MTRYEIVVTILNQPTMFQLSLRKNIYVSAAPLEKMPTSSRLTP